MPRNIPIYFLSCFFLFSIVKCSSSPEKTDLEIGEKIHIMPIEKSSFAIRQNQFSNIHIVFDLGGKTLAYSDEITIVGYSKKSSLEPIFKVDADDIESSYEYTDCQSELIVHLENSYSGDGLFCNGFIELDKINYWVAERKGKRNKIATSHITNSFSDKDGVVSITIPFR